LNELRKKQPQRYSEIYNKLKWGITQKVLNERLKELEKEKIITKKEFKEYPKRVEYKLTRKGQELIKLFKTIEVWGDKYYKVKE
ncbi:MAG: helix-turn-helix domain-containing protein, partial [archaeon]